MPTPREHPKLSRRSVVGGVGASVLGAAVVRPPCAHAARQAATSPERFGRLFDLPPFADNTFEVRAALRRLGEPGGQLDATDPLHLGPERLITDPEASRNNPNNTTHTAGTHFMGQFIDHDVTFDVDSKLAIPRRPEETRNRRDPRLDLDSVYGGGPSVAPQLYLPHDLDKFKVGFGGRFEDLPRDDGRVALVADPRNDENLMVAGLHAAFLLAHNRRVDELRADRPGGGSVFERARLDIVRHYQWLVVNEFLPLFVGKALVDDILHNGRKYFRPQPGEHFIPVEFQAAAYRMGHSMVRPSYAANLFGNLGGEPFFGFIFDPDSEGRVDPDDLRGGARAPRRFIGWEVFFDFGDGNVRPNKRIDTRLSTPLFTLPLATIPTRDQPTVLAQRNLLRQLTWSLPSGQDVAELMRTPVLRGDDLAELHELGVGFEHSTPLWYYVLKEAEVLTNGLYLGPMGGRIVAEVIIGLIQTDPESYLAHAGWRPTLPRRSQDRFRMTDLLTFAGVDPASRRAGGKRTLEQRW
ncbi:peroxidase family protein [Amycolatopsis aidingensis]|uniref:peroxidase family protein n=1 Tax=Amycolatopsis aidingensis TaxID=2842453 RepID=UPI001C0DC97D|nr:peroxidase family protein [Amycolatopsis aidingensis]